MSHRMFELNLNSIYKDINFYFNFKQSGRIKLMIDIFLEEKDFRYIIPMFLMSGFDFEYFVTQDLKDINFIPVFENLYIRTRRIALDIKRSVKNRDELADYHRCSLPKISLDFICNDIKSVPNRLVLPIYNYKLDSEFFYEDAPRFNLFGPLYIEMKDKQKAAKKIKSWESLPIAERKFSNSNCVIEYYIYSGAFPIEGKLVKADIKKSRMYLKPTEDGLRSAIKQRDPELLGFHLSQYESLPVTIKKAHHSFIINNYPILVKHIKRCDLPYLNAWRGGNYEFTKEP